MLFIFSHNTHATLNSRAWGSLHRPVNRPQRHFQTQEQHKAGNYLRVKATDFLSPATPLLKLHNIIVNFRAGEQFLVGLGSCFRVGLQILDAIVSEEEVSKVLDRLQNFLLLEQSQPRFCVERVGRIKHREFCSHIWWEQQMLWGTGRCQHTVSVTMRKKVKREYCLWSRERYVPQLG